VSDVQTAQKRLAGLLIKRPGFALAICGPAGIGKTFTIQRLLQDSPCQKLTVHASISLGALARALPRPKRLAAWAQHELAKSEPSLEAISTVLSGIAPVTVCVEDLHDCSVTQLEFWQALAGAVGFLKGVAVIATSRTVPPAPFAQIELESLSDEASAQLLKLEVGSALPSEVSTWIYERAAGNPLFTLEFFRFLMRRGFVWNDGTNWHWRTPDRDLLPATVEAMIERSILEACSEGETRTVLEARAYLESHLGAMFDTNLLVSVTGLDLNALRAADHQLRSKGVLNENGFVHPLFREVPVKTMSDQSRRQCAQRAIAALQDSAHDSSRHSSSHSQDSAMSENSAVLQNTEFLASRFVKDAGLDAPQARALLESAIESAEGSGQTRLAYELTLDALDLNLYDHAQQCRLGQRVAQYSLTRAASLFDQINPQQIEDVYVWATILAQLGRLSEAKTLLHNMLEPERQDIRWFEHLLLVHAQANDHAGAVAIWDQFKNQFGHDQSGHDFKFQLTIANSLTLVSRLQEASDLLEPIMNAAITDRVLADALIVRGQLFVYTGDFEHAYECGFQALGIYERLGETSGVGVSRYGLGMLVYYHGQLDLAAEHFSKAKQLYFEVGNQTRYLQNLMMFCATQTELGFYEQAERGLLEAEEQLPNGVPSEVLVEICNNLSFLYRGWDVPYGSMLALKYALKAVTAARHLNNPRLIVNSLYQASKSQTLAGHAEQGLRLADEALEVAKSVHYAALFGYLNHARYQALWALDQHAAALEALRNGEVGCRLQNFLVDADFYLIELECRFGHWDSARALVAALQAKGQVHRSNHAMRLYPKLDPELAAELDAEPNSEPNAKSKSKSKSKSALKPAPNSELNPELSTKAYTITTSGRNNKSQAPSQTPTTQLQVLGIMHFRQHNKSQPVRGQKRKELLAILLEGRIAGRSEMHRLELIDKIYPNEEEEQASISLRQAIRGIRTSLSPEVIATTETGYALGEVGSDAEEFFETGESGLWSGAYLEGFSFASIDETVRENLHLSLLASAKKILETDPETALRAGRILMAYDAYNLEHLALSIRALQLRSNHKSLNRLYDEARVQLLEVAEVIPERWQDFLKSRTKLTGPN
jgi:tetratricopeptide (TPR) repeat protein